jgi:AcrR family transcriptional regulator
LRYGDARAILRERIVGLGQAESARSRTKGRPRLEQSAEIDRAIRDAAMAVLLEHGEAATLGAVAQAAGLSRKTVYARYANKAELFIEVIRDLLSLAQGVDFDQTGRAEQRLHSFVRTAIEVMAKPQSRSIQRLLAVDPLYIATLKAEMQHAMHKQFFEPFHSLLAEAKRDDELAIDDVDATTRALLPMIFSVYMAPEGAGEPLANGADRDRYAGFITGLITRGLAPRS